MDIIIISNKTPDGELLQASFLPDRGMNMISYKKGEIEIIDQSTRSLFEERYAGLGSLIGPHFHRRHPATISPIQEDFLFPHIARARAKGILDPFTHGIGRYAPWSAQDTPNKVIAILSGKDKWNGIPLSVLEGQDFTMRFEAELNPDGLRINMSVVSDRDSLVGLHYYYALPEKKGKVISDVKNLFHEGEGLDPKQIPSSWDYDSQHMLTYDLSKSADYCFRPFFNPCLGKILLDTGAYRLQTVYESQNEENSWQLYHPENGSFVCIEPFSAQNPRRPNLTVSSISVHLQIL